MKKYLTGFLFGVLVAGATAAGAASITADHAPGVRYWFNGAEDVPTQVNTFMYQDRTYVPSRFVAENLNAEIDWDNQYKIVKIDNTKYTALTEQAGAVKYQLNSPHVTTSYATVKDGKTSLAFLLNADKADSQNAVMEEAGKVASLAVKGKVIPDTVEVHMYAQTPQGYMNTSAYIPSDKIQQFNKGEITAQDFYASWKLIPGNTSAK